jgi:Type III restriction enzyme, res subunit/Helicase conserved C-terminal domain
MDVRPGVRVQARGLTWDVVEVDRAADRDCLSLRCVEGDMAGLSWDIYVPPEQVALVDTALDPRSPVPLELWRLMHRSHDLNQLLDATPFVARDPGRVRVEPYQLVPLMRALDMPRPRLLLADGVGLGKTIQAGLIAAELIAQRHAHRILIVAPSGPLLRQWEQEMRLRFALRFTPVTNAAELWEIRREGELGANPFDAISLCITALDFAKQDHVLAELERSAWDLVIIDEAHHCVGFAVGVSQENTYRRRLAEVLARRCDALLLLTATPHDGHEAHFASLIALLDPSLVDGAGGFVGQEYRRHVIRRMKTHIRDPRTGAPLFRHRHVIPVKVDVAGPEHETVREFHRALSAFVVPRLRRRTGADNALAFVSLLKRSVSTISACLETLRVVVERLSRSTIDTKSAQRERARTLRAWRRRVARFGGLSAADEANQEALEIESMAEALRVEPDPEVARLIALGIAAMDHDPKLSAIVLEVRLIRLRNRRANILIYTEYTDSQLAAARALLAARGIEGEILTIGGRDSEQVRAAAAQLFAERDGLILISTDSLAEGLNLHKHCFHLIHLDLPYNPNRLEQRNGRIDRYGQQHEPEIRYLYIPGTFEESLLLHLIGKYERARSSLDVMPDTLGVTALPADYDAGLTGGLSEDPYDLFKADGATIQTLDRAVGDSSPETIAELMREIDRAYDAFDLMAVSHGWHAASGLNAEEHLPAVPAESFDLADFVADVAEAETGQTSTTQDEIRLPASWAHGLDGLPGFDAARCVMRFTRNPETWRDHEGRDLGYLGRAHPLVLRAIRHGCGLNGAVAMGCHDYLALLLTSEIEIRVSHRVMFRQIVAVIATPDRPPVEIDRWLAVGDAESTVTGAGVWDRLFASWSERAQSKSRDLLSRIASRRHKAFVARYDKMKKQQTAQSRRWLRVKANIFCGPFTPSTGDLFGVPDTGPAWRVERDPLTRLISFATDPATAAAKRREANEVIATFQAIEPTSTMPGPIVSRPLGMLMLVPGNGP